MKKSLLLKELEDIKVKLKNENEEKEILCYILILVSLLNYINDDEIREKVNSIFEEN